MDYSEIEFEQWYEQIYGHLKNADCINNATKELIKTAAKVSWETSATVTKIKMIKEGYRYE